MTTKMRVNMADYLMFPVFIICAAVSLGILSSTMLGFDLGATYNLGAGHGFSVANLLAIASLGYVAYTNDWSGGVAWKGIQGWLIVATIGLLIAPPFLPLLQNTLAETPAGLLALAVQAGGFATFSYVG
jgi:hypothetical protein